MGDEDDCRPPLGPEREQVVGKLPAGDLVQRRERLVEQQHLRVGDQGAGQGGAHGHAAGKLRRPRPLGAGEADPPQRRVRLRPRPPHADARQLERQGDVGQALSQGASVGDWNTTAVSPGPAARRTTPLGRRLQPGQQAQRGRLATARRADQGDDLARRQLEIEGTQRPAAPGVVDSTASSAATADVGIYFTGGLGRNCRVKASL